MMKLRLGLIGAAAIAVAVLWGMEHQTQRRLREENDSLREQVAQLEQLQIENARLSNIVAQTDTLAIREKLTDLLKLRREVNSLRQQLNEMNRVQADNDRLRQSIAARQTAEAAARREPPEVPSQDNHPRDTWNYVGYNTPEDTVQTMLWAMTQTNREAFFGGFSPEMTNGLAKLAGPGEFAEEIGNKVEQLTGFRVINREQISADEMVLTIYLDNEGKEDKTRFRRINGEWKISEGNVEQK